MYKLLEISFETECLSCECAETIEILGSFMEPLWEFVHISVYVMLRFIATFKTFVKVVRQHEWESFEDCHEALSGSLQGASFHVNSSETGVQRSAWKHAATQRH